MENEMLIAELKSIEDAKQLFYNDSILTISEKGFGFEITEENDTLSDRFYIPFYNTYVPTDIDGVKLLVYKDIEVSFLEAIKASLPSVKKVKKSPTDYKIAISFYIEKRWYFATVIKKETEVLLIIFGQTNKFKHNQSFDSVKKYINNSKDISFEKLILKSQEFIFGRLNHKVSEREYTKGMISVKFLIQQKILSNFII